MTKVHIHIKPHPSQIPHGIYAMDGLWTKHREKWNIEQILDLNNSVKKMKKNKVLKFDCCRSAEAAQVERKIEGAQG